MPAPVKHHPKRRQNNKVLGIGQDISDIKLISNERPLLAVIGGAVLEATITRTIGGASNIQITVHDPERKLLRKGLMEEKWEIHADGLDFRFKGIAKEGPDL